MRRAPFLFAVICFLLVLTSCSAPFTEVQAISKALEKNPGYPADPGKTNTIEVPIGGPEGNKAPVDLTTAVTSAGKDVYMVTLTKDWHYVVNGTTVLSTWQYRVSRDSIVLVESHDMDAVMNSIK